MSHARARSSFSRWKEFSISDLLSGFQVFLIALPLCLGIALASGFPPMAGIISAIVGGMFVSRISGSTLTINGPAAGLIVVILHGVELLGHGDPIAGYRFTLAAIVLAGAIELVLGLLKVGRFCKLVPSAVVHGMLAGIGVIIMIKQFPVLIGYQGPKLPILESIYHMPDMLKQMNPLIALIGFLSLAILIGLPSIPNKTIKKIPASIWVVLTGLMISLALNFSQNQTIEFASKQFPVGVKYLVPLPDQVWSSLAFPDFSQWNNPDFWLVVLSISLVAGLESLLSTIAVDKLDPLQRKSDLNRDLTAVGLGTMASAFLGGLPMIAEIVRSSANVSHGAKSSWSNFFHGLCLLLAVLIFPDILSLIPLTSLAALLIFTGYRLASPHEIKKMVHLGMDQLMIFLTTLFMVIATDLLIGIAAGMALKLFLHFMRDVRVSDLFKCRFTVNQEGQAYHITLHSALIFSNLLPLVNFLERVPVHSSVNLNLRRSSLIDHTSMERLHAIQKDFLASGGQLILESLEDHNSAAAHPLASRRLPSRSKG